MRTTFLLFFLLATACQAQPPGGGPPPGGGGIQGDGVWIRNAFFGEAQTFDGCNGHQPGNGQYHHHANPICLRAQLDDNVEPVRVLRTGTIYRERTGPWKHSPILGWSFDGYPIYGPYGYSDPKNASSEVRRIRSSFRLRQITSRDSLPAWALSFHTEVTEALPENRRGPAVNAEYPLGRYQEDFEYVAGLGDLDVYNGRTTVTPEFPQGTYAYFVTLNADGSPAFPYILGAQYYGTVTGGTERNLPTGGLQDHFQDGVMSPGSPDIRLLSSWSTKNSQQDARVVNSFDPSAEPLTTWAPMERPQGARVNGGVDSPQKADIQRIRYNDGNVWVNANGLASYSMGPWFDPAQPGGVFSNWPSSLNATYRVARSATEASGGKSTGGLGAVGVWVNGVGVFNVLDGGSYSNANGADRGGGIVNPTAVHTSAASFERGPLAAGSLVTAFPLFGSVLATTTTAASSAEWKTELGGTTVSITDSAGVAHPATVGYVSPAQITYRIPVGVEAGYGTVTIRAGGHDTRSSLHVAANYPSLFASDATGLAAGQLVRARDGQQTAEALTAAAIDPGPATDQLVLVLYGTGLGTDAVTATVGGSAAAVAFAGPQGTYAGLDQYNIVLPGSLAGKGRADVVITAGGVRSNSVYVTIR